MANDNRPAILGIVEKAFGGTGEKKQEIVGGDSAAKGDYQTGKKSSSKESLYQGKSTKAPGQSYSGSRKGLRKPAAAPPPRRKP